KILSTFRHTLDLFKDGKIDDCLIGCDFILKMDPRFAPARKLQEKAKNPKAEVDLEELWAVIAPPAPPAPPSRETGPVAPPIGIDLPSSGATPWIHPSDAGATAAEVRRDTDPAAVSGLENLSLDSLSLDGPIPDPSGAGRSGPAGIPFQSGLPAADARAPAFGDLSLGPTAADPGLASPLAASTEEEIAGLLKQGDDARAGGDRQQAIEIWSRIFLLDINHADAASRIEKTRAEIAQENRRAASAAAVPAVVVIGVFVATRPRAGKAVAVAPGSGSAPSLEHATMLFGEGKLAETRQELRRIPRSDPDYAKAQKLLASLETPKGAGESAPAASAPPPAVAPGETATNPTAVRAAGERALSEKRYIDAMKAFSS